MPTSLINYVQAGMVNDHVHDHVILVMLKMKAMVHKKSKETPGPAVAEPVPPLRNVGALVPGIQTAIFYLFYFQKMGVSGVAFSWPTLSVFNSLIFVQEPTLSSLSGQRLLWIRQFANIRSLLSLDNITGGSYKSWCLCVTYSRDLLISPVSRHFSYSRDLVVSPVS